MAENILVIKLGALGDFILALGAMQAIRKHHPDSKITLLTTKGFKDMAEKSGYFDEVVVTTRCKFYELGEWFRLIKFFNSGKFVRVYDLQNQDRSAIYYNLFLKKPEWSGVVSGSKLCYKNSDWKALHAFDRHKEILKVAGIENVEKPDISWMKSDVSGLMKSYGIDQPFVIFVPGCAPTRPEKRWPGVRYGGLGLKLIRDGYKIVLIGSKDDKDAIDIVKKTCRKAIDLTGETSLYDIYSLAELSSGIVGNDTGPCHIASLTNKPMVSLFCSLASSPKLSAPIGAKVRGIEATNMENIPVNNVYKVFKPVREEAADTEA